MDDKKYSGFAAELGYELEIQTFEVEQDVQSLSCKITIGEPVWLFPMIKNPDRKWWQVWKPYRVVDPRFSDIFEAVSKA